MMDKLEPFLSQLDALAGQSRLRRLIPRGGYDFASNDYLGLAGSDVARTILQAAIDRGVPHGSGGSRLLRGNHVEHELLEECAAKVFGSQAALYFSTGYAANSALFSTLPQSGDVVLYDALIHASAHEGMRLGRAQCQQVAHNDLQAFEDACRAYRTKGGKGRPWLAVESLYSMDGDRAPLDGLADIAERYDGFLIIDEAHATGVFGHNGRGLAEDYAAQDNVIILRTCGKALGAEGGLLCLAAPLRDFMVNRARGFIFSTAPSPLMAAMVRGIITMLDRDSSYQEQFCDLIAFAEQRLGVFCPAEASGSQIFPVIIGDNARTMKLATALQAQGFDVRGIRPPTVPQGTSRLRISLSMNVDRAAIDALAAAFDALDIVPMHGLAA